MAPLNGPRLFLANKIHSLGADEYEPLKGLYDILRLVYMYVATLVVLCYHICYQWKIWLLQRPVINSS